MHNSLACERITSYEDKDRQGENEPTGQDEYECWQREVQNQ